MDSGTTSVTMFCPERNGRDFPTCLTSYLFYRLHILYESCDISKSDIARKCSLNDSKIRKSQWIFCIFLIRDEICVFLFRIFSVFEANRMIKMKWIIRSNNAFVSSIELILFISFFFCHVIGNVGIITRCMLEGHPGEFLSRFQNSLSSIGLHISEHSIILFWMCDDSYFCMVFCR